MIAGGWKHTTPSQKVCQKSTFLEVPGIKYSVLSRKKRQNVRAITKSAWNIAMHCCCLAQISKKWVEGNESSTFPEF